ncbi:MAG: hypothetical protein R3F37_01070 [Candidatus Competibacteraceae bacterium]
MLHRVFNCATWSAKHKTSAAWKPGKLEVFVSEAENEMWVSSSWSGYEVLAYRQLGTDKCITRFGEIEAFEEPVPQAISGESEDWTPRRFRKSPRLSVGNKGIPAGGVLVA